MALTNIQKKVLMALYRLTEQEAGKDEKFDHYKLGLDMLTFRLACVKLEKKGLINIKFCYNGSSRISCLACERQITAAGQMWVNRIS